MNGEMIARNIQIILAPVVMITMCVILLGGLHGRYQTINDRLRLMTAERPALLRETGRYRVAQIRVATLNAADTTSRNSKFERGAEVSSTDVRRRLGNRAYKRTRCAIS